MALLPRGHELAEHPAIPLKDLLFFPLLSCNEDRLPGLLAQMRAIVRKYTEQTTLAGAANTLSRYVTGIAAGTGVGLADAGHTQEHGLGR